MASLPFPDAGSRRAEDTAGRPAVAKAAVVYSDAAGTTLATIYADAAGAPGAAVTGSVLTTDAYGFLPLFWGPASGEDRLYVSVNGGPVWPVDADYNARVDVLAARVAVVEAGGGDGGAGLVAHEAATTNVHGVASTAALETASGAQAKIATHAAVTTSVHGIADTGALETSTGAQAKADAAQSAATAAAVATSAQRAANLGDLANAGTARTNLGLGGAATLDVGATADTVTAGDDDRLTDARTPTSHAATHASAGSDPVTVAQSQVTGLAASLAAKADLVGGVVPSAQIPAIAVTDFLGGVADEAGMLALVGEPGDWTIRADTSTAWVITGVDPSILAGWTELPGAGGGDVTSVNTQTGAVVLAASDVGAVPTARTITAGSYLTGGGDLTANRTVAASVGTTAGTLAAGDDSRITGAAQKSANLSDLASAATSRTNLGLGNVDNTTDANKPVSTATQTALNLKANLAGPTFTGTVAGITKAMVGLGNVDNTTDAAKPVSTATQTALNTKVGKGDLVLNVKDSAYGATGDGTTDDTAAFTAVINASTAGARIFMPPGTYIVASTLLPKAGTTFYGVRGKTVVKTKPAVTGFNVFQVSVNDVIFEDFTIDLNKAATTDPATLTVGLGIYIAVTSGGTGHVVRRVEVKNGHQIGLRFQGHNGQSDPATLNPSEVVFDECNVHDCNQHGIMAVNTTNLRIVNCLTKSNGSDGIQNSTSRNTVITGCTSESNGGHGIVAQYVEACKVTSNNARSNTFWGIALGGGSATINANRRYVAANNVVDNNGLGGITNDPTITGAPGVPVDLGMVVSSNVCFNNVTNHGISLQNVKNAVVANNVCFGNPNAGIAVHGTYCAITGNLAFNNGYGLSLQADGTEPDMGHHRISGNLFHSNTTADTNAAAAIADIGTIDLPMNVQEFTASGTWNKPTGGKTTQVILIAPGGPGGSGAKGPSGTVRTGGAGGGGGGRTVVDLFTTDLASTVAVTVPTGSAGGASVTTNSTAGNPGTVGSNTTFGSYAVAMCGGRGFGGSTAGASGGVGGGGTSGGGTGGTSTVSAAGSAPSNNGGGGGGGGSGGTITSGNTATNGGNGGAAQIAGTSFGAAGIVGGASPTSGTASSVKGMPAPGAGGGAASRTGNAQAGANGVGYGSAGGGGGAAEDGVGDSGAGGNSGPGYALAITRF